MEGGYQIASLFDEQTSLGLESSAEPWWCWGRAQVHVPLRWTGECFPEWCYDQWYSLDLAQRFPPTKALFWKVVSRTEPAEVTRVAQAMSTRESRVAKFLSSG